ncbi:MAG: molybdate transport system substrate-binding protein [Alcanivorax sp.]|jgi:molybdate transport system substrate-binding protein
MKSLKSFRRKIALFASLSLLSSAALADPLIRVAVASNFLVTAHHIADDFEAQSGTRVEIVSGSTGKLYAQIRLGAPYDVFLAADMLRPTLLFDEGLSDPVKLYARGKLALWAPTVSLTSDQCDLDVIVARPKNLALANPDVAPYGRAALEVLEKLPYYASGAAKLVYGESVGQVYSYLLTGALDAGFLSLAQVKSSPDSEGTCVLEVASNQYQPVDQGGVVLLSSNNVSAAREFVGFLKSAEIRTKIEQSGYSKL